MQPSFFRETIMHRLHRNTARPWSQRGSTGCTLKRGPPTRSIPPLSPELICNSRQRSGRIQSPGCIYAGVVPRCRRRFVLKSFLPFAELTGCESPLRPKPHHSDDAPRRILAAVLDTLIAHLNLGRSDTLVQSLIEESVLSVCPDSCDAIP